MFSASCLHIVGTRTKQEQIFHVHAAEFLRGCSCRFGFNYEIFKRVNTERVKLYLFVSELEKMENRVVMEKRNGH